VAVAVVVVAAQVQLGIKTHTRNFLTDQMLKD
jgi:hypothetical protein